MRGAPATGELRVRLAADPASVPGARRFVADGLREWGLADLVDDATLCVSELATNAALHSASTFMEIVLRPLDRSVRISVEDDGMTPAAAVQPRSSFTGSADDPDLLLADEATTGRGLGIVSILASEWGVEQTDHGKRVWITLVDDGAEHRVRPPRTDVVEEQPPPDATLPEGWVLVRLVGCPVQLSLRQDEHLDELIRELQLMEGDTDNPVSREIAARMEGLLSGPAHARHTGRRIAQRAAAEGKTHIDIEMAAPRELSLDIVALEDAVKAADQLCQERRMLTLASPPELRRLRAWMTQEILAQAIHGEEPLSWDDWLADQPADG